MGFAIIISDAYFAKFGLGKVTPTENTQVQGLSIISPETIESGECFLSVEFSPRNTSQRDVLWSIESGSELASVDNIGVLTAKDGAFGNVIVKATSVSNPLISATRTIYIGKQGFVAKDAIIFDKKSAINTNVKVSSKIRVEIDFTWVWSNSEGSVSGVKSQTILGGRISSSSNRRDIFAQHGTNAPITLAWGSGNGAQVTGLSEGRHTIVTEQSSFMIDGKSYSNANKSQNFSTEIDLIIGAQNNNGSIDYTYGSLSKYHDFKVYDDGVLVLHLIPGLYNNKPCFKDMVSGDYFYNIGSGTLMAE